MSLRLEFGGCARYLTQTESEHGQLVVAVVCRFGHPSMDAPALLDTAAEWSILPWTLAQRLGLPGVDEVPESHRLRFSTRLGLMEGHVVRVGLLMPAHRGDSLAIEASCLVSQEWLGPPVLGWRGCLERVRFALDPRDDLFYFAALG